MKRLLLVAALLPVAPWVSASPLDAAAEVPALRFSSAFADYRAFDDAGPDDWRRSNRVVDEAARQSAGAHAGHGAPAARPAAPSARPTGQDQNDHQHNGQHRQPDGGALDHRPQGDAR